MIICAPHSHTKAARQRPDHVLFEHVVAGAHPRGRSERHWLVTHLLSLAHGVAAHRAAVLAQLYAAAVSYTCCSAMYEANQRKLPNDGRAGLRTTNVPPTTGQPDTPPLAPDGGG